MTGFDSEADRRDAVRTQIVDAAVDAVHRALQGNAVTATYEERLMLEVCVVERLLQGMRIEAMSQVYRQEIATAEQKLEES
jgi:hypothetical protein